MIPDDAESVEMAYDARLIMTRETDNDGKGPN